MNYQVQVSGTLHSPDNIVNIDAYAKATFIPIKQMRWWRESHNSIGFRMQTVKLDETTSLDSITNNIVKGDLSNVSINIALRSMV